MTQAKLAPMILLLGPFVAKNLEIYQGNEEMLASFEDLELSDLIIGPVTKADGVHTAHIKSLTRGFEGPDQKWRPASVHSDKVFTQTAEEPLESKEAVEALTTPGVYAYLDSEGEIKRIVAIPAATALEMQAAEAAIALNDALCYDLPADQIVLGDGVITVNGDTITGDVEYVLATAPMIVLPEGSIMDLG